MLEGWERWLEGAGRREEAGISRGEYMVRSVRSGKAKHGSRDIEVRKTLERDPAFSACLRVCFSLDDFGE